MPLLDLANELILQIVDSLLAEDAQTTYHLGTTSQLTRLSPLSRTCKRLNAVCGTHIFRQYYLNLHNGVTSEIQQPPQSGSIMHALSKADHIQELIISHGDPQEDHRSNYNAAILDSLESLLVSTPKLASVTLKSDVRQLSDSFWNILLSKHLRHLEVQGWESISDDYQVLAPLVLDKFVLCYHQRTSRLLDDVRTANLSLRYADVHPRPGLPFKPTDAMLRNVHVEVIPPLVVSSAILDFGAVPQARIHVDIPLHSQSQLEVQPTLKEVRTQLPRIFADDLSQLNVYLKFDQAFTVSRPSLTSYPNWRPMLQEHLSGNERDSVDMYAYWANKITR